MVDGAIKRIVGGNHKRRRDRIRDVELHIRGESELDTKTGHLRINGIPFSVLQMAPQLNLALRSYTAGSGAGSGSLGLTVTPSVNWTAASSAAWLTVNPLSGSGNATLTFGYTANSSVNARMATIVVGGQQFSVLQMGTSGAYTPYGNVGRDNITTIAGTGTSGYSGDGGAATLAQINSPYTVAVEGSGNVYFPDSSTHRIRKVDASTGNVTTVAGDGTRGSLGDGSPAIWARLDSPCAVAVDSGGNWFIVDAGNKRIRRVSASTGNITSIAGTELAACALALDGAGSLYFADSRYQIQRMDLATGLTLPIAGNGTSGYSGDGGAALSAQLSQPGGLAVDGSGNVYIADSANFRVRMVSAATGLITTVAGNGTYGIGGDGGLATAANLRYPRSLALDKAGNLFIADPQGYRVRKVTASTGVISTIAGSNGSGSTGDGGPATSAQLNGPNGVALDGTGNVYIGEAYGYRIRFVDVSLLATATAVGTISPEPSTVGQAYSVSYTVTSGAGTPAGNVTVTDGTATNTCTVAAGNCLLTSTSAGTKTITVTYAGGGNYSGSSGTKAHVVNADPLFVPDLTVSKTHTGNFAAGQVGATYTITVNNVGAGVTSGAVTVTDTLPAGLTASGIGGSGWNCTQPAGPCSRSDTLAGGSSYPAITLTVNVSPTPPRRSHQHCERFRRG